VNNIRPEQSSIDSESVKNQLESLTTEQSQAMLESKMSIFPTSGAKSRAEYRRKFHRIGMSKFNNESEL
jgi:hypothetical protein